jgi:hydrogenase nickel incorporation protein HypB
MSERIKVNQSIFAGNNEIAQRNLDRLNDVGLLAIDVLASPGAGKTSLVEQTLFGLRENYDIAVINGDLASRIDADRAAHAGAIALQINTGGGCHLDAQMLQGALDQLRLEFIELLIVENVTLQIPGDVSGCGYASY